MAREDEYNFTVIDDNGKEVICDVISLLKDEKNGDMFVLYTDYTLNDKNQFNTYLSQLVENKGEYRLKSIENREKYNYLLENTHAVYGKAINELISKES
jgi:uncharacterized protein YrzB (UPF0473 family)